MLHSDILVNLSGTTPSPYSILATPIPPVRLSRTVVVASRLKIQEAQEQEKKTPLLKTYRPIPVQAYARLVLVSNAGTSKFT